MYEKFGLVNVHSTVLKSSTRCAQAIWARQVTRIACEYLRMLEMGYFICESSVLAGE